MDGTVFFLKFLLAYVKLHIVRGFIIIVCFSYYEKQAVTMWAQEQNLFSVSVLSVCNMSLGL
jgi:hypothetical protein